MCDPNIAANLQLGAGTRRTDANLSCVVIDVVGAGISRPLRLRGFDSPQQQDYRK
jgi:hypothetical protein